MTNRTTVVTVTERKEYIPDQEADQGAKPGRTVLVEVEAAAIAPVAREIVTARLRNISTTLGGRTSTLTTKIITTTTSIVVISAIRLLTVLALRGDHTVALPIENLKNITRRKKGFDPGLVKGGGVRNTTVIHVVTHEIDIAGKSETFRALNRTL